MSKTVSTNYDRRFNKLLLDFVWKSIAKKNVGKKTANNISISSFKRINLNKIDGKDNAIIIIVR